MGRIEGASEDSIWVMDLAQSDRIELVTHSDGAMDTSRCL